MKKDGTLFGYVQAGSLEDVKFTCTIADPCLQHHPFLYCIGSPLSSSPPPPVSLRPHILTGPPPCEQLRIPAKLPPTYTTLHLSCTRTGSHLSCTTLFVISRYFETDRTMQECLDGMAHEPINTVWQETMAKYFPDQDVNPDETMVELEEVMHLDI